ncbi:MAG: Rieske 2Fe-2S domain-containing protein [Nitrososphaerales archaeon]
MKEVSSRSVRKKVREGSMFGVAGNPVLLSKIERKIYSVNAVCSRYNGYLPRGELRHPVVICPVHKAQFDITAGSVAKNVPALMKYTTNKEATDLRTYEVETIAGNIRVMI